MGNRDGKHNNKRLSFKFGTGWLVTIKKPEPQSPNCKIVDPVKRGIFTKMELTQ